MTAKKKESPKSSSDPILDGFNKYVDELLQKPNKKFSSQQLFMKLKLAGVIKDYNQMEELLLKYEKDGVFICYGRGCWGRA